MPYAYFARRYFGHVAEGGVSIVTLPTGLGGRGMLDGKPRREVK